MNFKSFIKKVACFFYREKTALEDPLSVDV